MPDTVIYTPQGDYYYYDTILSDSAKNNLRPVLLQQDQYYREKNKQSWLDENYFNIFLVVIMAGLFYRAIYEIQKREKKFTQPSRPAVAEPAHFVYKGRDLDFDKVTLEIICLKYIAFFRTLDKPDQQLFLKKLQAFMRQKQFWIYGKNCYREVPILLSATAMQLCFGIGNFYLDNYPFIVIRPEAYFGYWPLRILTGNVQGNSVTVSWEHFLKDHLDEDDGNNVGLHEMAHAFAMQLLYSPSEKHQSASGLIRVFYEKLEEFVIYEKLKSTSLFDAYSLQNADECWAKCIELFFEKREKLKFYYPELYDGVRKILNQ